MLRKPISRRNFLAATGATAAAITGFPAIVRAQSKTIVTTLYGGKYEENYRKFVLDPFSEKTGAEFIIKYGSADEWLNNSLINRGDPEITLPMLSIPVATRAVRIPDLFIELSPDDIPNLKDIHPIFYDTYQNKAVGFNYVDYGILYRTDMVEKPITSFADLWDPSLKGKLACPGPTAGPMYEFVMIAARLADGGTDWRKGIEKLKELKPNVFRWFNTSNDIDTLLPRGEAAVAACFGSFRSYLLIDGGMPGKFITPTEGSPMGVLSYHIPANAPNRDLLLEFVNHALDAEVQTNFGNAMTSGMANTKVQLEQRVIDRIASPDELLRIDWNVIQDNYADITAAMQREVII